VFARAPTRIALAVGDNYRRGAGISLHRHLLVDDVQRPHQD
jgi:hypothetical protein